MRNTIEYLLKKKITISFRHIILQQYRTFFTCYVYRKRQRTSGIEFYLTEIRWLPRCRVVYVVNLWPIVLFIPRVYVYIIYSKYKRI